MEVSPRSPVEIYGTLGPACSAQAVLESMFRAGMTGMRLNLSHVSLFESQGLLKTFFAAARACAVTPALLIDMQGPELRVGRLSSPAELAEGETVVLGQGGFPVPELVQKSLAAGQQVLLDDGKLLLRITDANGVSARGLVLRGGTLLSRKSIALPGLSLHPPAMAEDDIENLRLAADLGVTGVMQPFVRSPEDLAAVRAALDRFGADKLQIYAKIENAEGLAQLPKLLPAADAIIIARGDLGNDLGLCALPGVQKEIAAACRRAGKPFTVATQLLASMEKSAVPTRAETSDVFNAVLDGAMGLMLTGETAVGAYPVEAVRYLSDTASAARVWQKKSSGAPRSQ